MARVKFGINIPQFHEEQSALFQLGGFVTRAESLGFDSIWTLDGIFHDIPFLEPLTCLAYAAAVTKRMELGTAVLLLPLRPPAVVAQTLATIDFLSSGRLVAGTGLGGRQMEFDACAVPMRERVPRFTEALQIMRMLWTRDRVDFAGRFWKLQAARLLPRPARPGGIPVLIGGSQLGAEVNEKALMRASRLGDGWLGAGSTALAAHERSTSKFVRFAEESGRDPDTLQVAKRIYIHVDSDREGARGTLDHMLRAFYGRPMNVEETCLYGSSSECADRINGLVESGTRTMIFNSVSDHVNQAEILARDVIPAIR